MTEGASMADKDEAEWGPNGKFGNDPAHARPCSPELEKEMDEADGFERIGFRLDKELIAKYESIASKQGVSDYRIVMRVALQHYSDEWGKRQGEAQI